MGTSDNVTYRLFQPHRGTEIIDIHSSHYPTVNCQSLASVRGASSSRLSYSSLSLSLTLNKPESESESESESETIYVTYYIGALL